MGALKVLTFGWEMAPVMNGGLGVVCRDLPMLSFQRSGHDICSSKLPHKFKFDSFNLVNAAEYDLSEDEIKNITISTLMTHISVGLSLIIHLKVRNLIRIKIFMGLI
jgi:hypothetical protein